jgi:hypothetical protein
MPATLDHDRVTGYRTATPAIRHKRKPASMFAMNTAAQISAFWRCTAVTLATRPGVHIGGYFAVSVCRAVRSGAREGAWDVSRVFEDRPTCWEQASVAR